MHLRPCTGGGRCSYTQEDEAVNISEDRQLSELVALLKARGQHAVAGILGLSRCEFEGGRLRVTHHSPTWVDFLHKHEEPIADCARECWGETFTLQIAQVPLEEPTGNNSNNHRPEPDESNAGAAFDGAERNHKPPPRAKSDSGEQANRDATLQPQHIEFLKQRAVPEQVWRERGYRTISVKARLEDKGFSSTQRRVPGLLIPLFNARGECAGYQYRPDEPRVLNGRAVKYESPSKSRPVVDVPKRLSLPRKVEQKTPFDAAELPPPIIDETVPLFITEGAPKADAAVGIGLCCIGILGVAGWHRLPGWNDFPIRGRTFYLCFDSDAIQWPEVA
jgi:hypothetical protein